MIRLLLPTVLISIAYSCKYSATISDQTDIQIDLGCMDVLEFDSTDGFQWLYTPCKDGDTCTNGGETIKGMLVQTKSDPDECYLVAVWDQSVPSTYNEGSQQWSMHFANGDDCFGSPREFTAVFRCNPDVKSNVISVEEPFQCDYEMIIETYYACGNDAPNCSGGGGGGDSSSDDGLSGGWIFVIILIGVIFLYCVVGYIVMALTVNKDGGFGDVSNNIPNKTLWFAMPSLVIAGCGFTKDFLLGLCNKGGAEQSAPLAADDEA